MKTALLVLSSLLMFALPLQAQQPRESIGLDPFPLSTLISEQQRQEPDYRLILGGIIKINGLIRSDREQRLQAQLTRLTWQLPSGHSPEAGFNYLRDQLLRQNAKVLFECAGRQCGPSSLWANDIFGQARLYGVDSSQFYAAFALPDAHLAIYAVRRGNGRVYLHLDRLERDAPTVTELSERLRQQGYAVLEDWPDSSDRSIQALLDLQERFPRAEFWLTIHWRGEDLDLSISQSEAAARQLLRQLADKGGDMSRIKGRGVGALVPSVLGSRRQVAVVVLKAR